MRISCSAYSSDCIPLPTSRAPASVSPPSGASSPGTAAGSGRKAPSIRARRSTSLCDGPLPAGLEALVNPGKILLVEDNPDDVALTLRALKSQDRKSTRLNSSHGYISYAVFCLKKKNTTHRRLTTATRRTELSS